MKKPPLQVFEHQTVRVDRKTNGVQLSQSAYEALKAHHGDEGVPYYTLSANGVRFNHFVGVLQIGDTVIEVLPKADKGINDDDKKKAIWQRVLIDMLLEVRFLVPEVTSASSLKLRPNSILEAYFELFIQEVEFILNQGLVKKYRLKEGNVTALKGSLKFGQHIQQNLTHQERFYVRHTTYDVEHLLHFVLYKAIKLVKRISSNVALHGRVGALMLHFPEMPEIKVTEATFERISYNRKTFGYKNAINIAKLLLLNYYPDIRNGRNDVLALMFDMNALWERFVLVSLYKLRSLGWSVSDQKKRGFWKSDDIGKVGLKPDIWIHKDDQNLILDTKWKNIGNGKPTSEDLRQLYAYGRYFRATKVALVYPGTEDNCTGGTYEVIPPEVSPVSECSMILLAVPTGNETVKGWKISILNTIAVWANFKAEREQLNLVPKAPSGSENSLTE